MLKKLGFGLAASLGLIGADYASKEYSKHLTEKYYGRTMPHEGSSFLPQTVMLGVFGALVGRTFGSSIVSSSIGKRGAESIFHKSRAARFAMKNIPMVGMTGLGFFASNRLADGGEEVRSRATLPIMFGTMSLAALMRGAPGLGTAFGGFAFASMGEDGISPSLAIGGIGAGLTVSTVAKMTRYGAQRKKRSTLNKAIDSAVGGFARFAGKTIPVDKLRDQISELAKFPAVLGPALIGAGVGGAIGGAIGYNSPMIAPEYANRLEMSSGPTMPVDNYTSGLSLGMHRNRKRRRL